MKSTTRRGQIWIETVLYTLIGLSLIALVLSFAYPKIRATQENLLVGQGIATLANLDQVITTVSDRGPGNTKTYTFTLKRGTLTIDEEKESITLVLKDIHSEYSEPGAVVQDGRVSVLTTKGPKTNTVTLALSFVDSLVPTKKLLDIQIGDTTSNNDIKEFAPAATPYVLSISYGQKPGTIFIEEGAVVG